MRLRVRKLSGVPGGAPPIAKDAYQPGTEQPEPYSIPVDYEVEGEIQGFHQLPVVGESFTMLRHSRNGASAIGVFATSPVTEVTKNGFTTQNSVYQLELIGV